MPARTKRTMRPTSPVASLVPAPNASSQVPYTAARGTAVATAGFQPRRTSSASPVTATITMPTPEHMSATRPHASAAARRARLGFGWSASRSRARPATRLPPKLIWKAHTTFSAPTLVKSRGVEAATATQGATPRRRRSSTCSRATTARCAAMVMAW